MTKAYVETLDGIPTLMIDGKPYFGNAVTVASNRDGILKLDEAYYRNLGLSGARIFFLICDTEFTKPDAYELFRTEAEAILRAVPDAYIIPRVGLQPSKAWTDAHPEAMVQWNDGKYREAYLRTESYTAYIGPYSLHSEVWRQEAGKALLDFCEKIEAEPFGDRIIGFFPAAGNTSEWLPAAPVLNANAEGVYFDTSENFREEFRSYLTEKYGENAPLPIIPDMDDRYYLLDFDQAVADLNGGRPHHPAPGAPTEGKCTGSFADVEKKPSAVDFFMAWGEATAKSVLYFAGLIKERWPHKLTGAFYAYTRWVHMGGNFSGTMRILKDGRVDFCAAPGDYQNRQPGGWEALRAPADSLRIHNMLFLAEDDTRTQKENLFYRSAYGIYDEKDAESVMKRNFGKNLCSGNYAWWFDQHHGGGRYNSEASFRLMRKQYEIAADVTAQGRYKNNEIALIYDTESRMAASHNTSHHSITVMKNFSLGKIGAPYDEYLLEDMENENMPDYKLYIFSAAYMMDAKKIAYVKRKLQKNHATALWLYGAGYINMDAEQKMCCENMQALTGFTIHALSDYAYDSHFKICGDAPITGNLQRNHIYGQADALMFGHQFLHTYEPRPYLCPLFYLEDDETGIFGKFCEGGRAAAAVKEFEGFTSVWCGAKYLQYDFIRAMALFAGCHIFSMDGDVIYEGSGYLTIHSTCGGHKTIALKKACSPYEVYEEKAYGEETDTIELDMDEGQTKMFLLR
ncbi:MAG: hypothetical protein IJN25_06170 [Clostridia bacterium]|nr:hypothetical protein [Clostridia bacterium]